VPAQRRVFRDETGTGVHDVRSLLVKPKLTLSNGVSILSRFQTYWLIYLCLISAAKLNLRGPLHDAVLQQRAVTPEGMHNHALNFIGEISS
jgi:hypothetical protein